jgi:hypothetical protein
MPGGTQLNARNLGLRERDVLLFTAQADRLIGKGNEGPSHRLAVDLRDFNLLPRAELLKVLP